MRSFSSLLLVGAAAAVFRQRLHPDDTRTASAGTTGGDAAFVTPYLPDRYKDAQALSEVKVPGWTKSALHGGFFTIDQSTGSNTYFAFAEALVRSAVEFRNGRARTLI
jgi:hypothetical protein